MHTKGIAISMLSGHISQLFVSLTSECIFVHVTSLILWMHICLMTAVSARLNRTQHPSLDRVNYHVMQ